MTLYDPECQTLAEHFLQDEPSTLATAPRYEQRVRSLAEAIQDAVEEWFADESNHRFAEANRASKV